MENRGIDPRTSRMLSERSTILASSPATLINGKDDKRCVAFHIVQRKLKSFFFHLTQRLNTTRPDEGLEPATLRLKVWCSTDWANRAWKLRWLPMRAWFIEPSCNLNHWKSCLPGGESNPGLPRDRRGYSPLYYRGRPCQPDTTICEILTLFSCVGCVRSLFRWVMHLSLQ